MGWWSDDIMGGDTPLDIESFIYDALEVNQFPEDEDGQIRIPKDKFNYKKIVKYLKGRDSEDYYVTGDGFNIFHQVLGIMMMEAGAPINHTLKNKMIKGAENDEWANEDLENNDEGRRDKMDAFISVLGKYGGTPTKINSKGLMETISDAIVGNDVPTIDDAVNDNDISANTIREIILAHVDDYRHENVNKLLDKLVEISK